MKAKDQAREWLEERCGRHAHIETHLVNASTAPSVHEGRITKPEEAASLPDLYEVGLVSYNLADLPDDLEVEIEDEPAERLQMVFDDGASVLIKVLITVT